MISTAGSSYWGVVRNGWSAYIHRAGNYQSQVLLNVIYFVVFGPGAFAARLFGASLLDLDARPRTGYWTERKPTRALVEGLERQF